MKRERHPRPAEVDWDEAKNEYNKRKHEGISFEEAQSVFNDPLAKTVDDLDHSYAERRYLTVGYSIKGMLLVLWHTYPDTGYRLIGARKVNRSEKRNYEEGE